MKSLHFLNLTNGLEWFSEVESPQLLRIESTAIEKNDKWRILRDLDVNFLMALAIGNECHVYDCGTRREMSKTISWGIPFIHFMLHNLWSGNRVPLRSQPAREAGRKIRYFSRYYNGTVRLHGHSRSTTHDGDREFYADIVRRMNDSNSTVSR